jgi:hypothetical protein
MKALRRFPSLEAHLRDGRACLTTVNLLAPVLTDDNFCELIDRAAYLSKAETERLVVSVRPRVAPRDGIRLVRAQPAPTATGTPAAVPVAPAPSTSPDAGPTLAPFVLEAPSPSAPPRAEIRPVSADLYSLRVTIDSACKAELDQLIALTSHSTRGDLAAVVREAIRCALVKHGRRKGAVAPERKKAAPAREPDALATAPTDPRYVPADVKSAVWAHDGGRCGWVSPESKRCGSTWKLEFGHIKPVALGGKSTVANVRLECLSHDTFEAIRVFGPEYMAPYLRTPATPGGRHGV